MRVLLNVRQQLLIPLLKESWQELIVVRVVEVFDHALSLISDLNQTVSVLIKLLLRRSLNRLNIHSLREGSLFRSATVQSSVDLSICWSHLSPRASILHRSIMGRGLALGEQLRLGFLDGSIWGISLALTISDWVSVSQTRLRPLFVRLRPHLILTWTTLVLREPSTLREIIRRIL
jgi:hypothetical protein